MNTKAKVIDALRSAPDTPQGDLARELGVSRQRISQIMRELGVARVSAIPVARSDVAVGPHKAEHKCWLNMIRRCTDQNCHAWGRYGGRGITVCERWMRSFRAFLSDMGSRPSRRHSIDRVDNSLGYDPVNCRWATPAEQSRNRREYKPRLKPKKPKPPPKPIGRRKRPFTAEQRAFVMRFWGALEYPTDQAAIDAMQREADKQGVIGLDDLTYPQIVIRHFQKSGRAKLRRKGKTT